MEGIRTARDQRGQGMVEYIIIVAMIALAAIGAFTYFGDTVRAQVAQMSAQVAGTNDDAAAAEAKQSSQKALNEAKADYNLGTYQDGDAQ